MQRELDDLERYEIKKPGKEVLEEFYETALEFIQNDKKFKVNNLVILNFIINFKVNLVLQSTLYRNFLYNKVT